MRPKIGMENPFSWHHDHTCGVVLDGRSRLSSQDLHEPGDHESEDPELRLRATPASREGQRQTRRWIQGCSDSQARRKSSAGALCYGIGFLKVAPAAIPCLFCLCFIAGVTAYLVVCRAVISGESKWWIVIPESSPRLLLFSSVGSNLIGFVVSGSAFYLSLRTLIDQSLL